MTFVIALLAVAGAIALVALAYAVGRLQGEVKRLHSDLDTARAAFEPPAPEQPPAPAPVEIVVEPLEPEAVPVITAIDQRADDVDFSVSRVVSVTLARPIIKVAAFSYGVRRAMGDENRFRIRYAMRQEFRRQRKLRRRRRAGRAPATFERRASRPDVERGR